MCCQLTDLPIRCIIRDDQGFCRSGKHIDGYTATQQIRVFEAASDIDAVPVIALTAHAMSDHRQKCIDVGMNDVLTKPLNIARVQSALDSYIEPTRETN